MLKKAERLNTPSWCTPGSFSSQSGDKVVPVMAAGIKLALFLYVRQSGIVKQALRVVVEKEQI